MKTTKPLTIRENPDEHLTHKINTSFNTRQPSQVFHHCDDSVELDMNNALSIESSDPSTTCSASNDDIQHAMPFVLIEEPLLPASKEHRKTVRHHVMRAVHSRRRAQNKTIVRKNTLIKKDNSASSAPKQDEEDPDASASGSYASSTSSLDPDTMNEAVDELKKPASAVIFQATQTQQLLIVNHNESSTRRLKGQGGTMEDSQFFSIAGFVRPFDQWTFDTATPYAIFQLDGAPILCMRSEGWPFPDVAGRLTPKVSVWMPSRIIPIPNSRSPRDCLHNSAQVLPYIHNSQEYFALKVETTKWINERLPHDVLGISDTTIGSILLLISFEIARGNIAKSIQHVNGLERIVNLRGGINSFASNKHFLVKVLLLDLIVSLMSNTSLRFIQASASTALPANVLGIRLNRISDSPLCRTRRLDKVLHGSAFCLKSIRSLKNMQDLVACHQTRSTSPNYTLPPLSATKNKPITLLHRVIHLTATIFAAAMHNPPTPFSSALNLPIAQELCQALESPTNDATWDAFPGKFVWILSTGAAASPDSSPEHSYFVSLLMKVELGAGYGWFDELRRAMEVFSEIKRRAEGLSV